MLSVPLVGKQEMERLKQRSVQVKLVSLESGHAGTLGVCFGQEVKLLVRQKKDKGKWR